MEFSRQEYWSGLPPPTPGDLPHPRMELESAALAGRFFTTEPPGKPHAYEQAEEYREVRFRFLIRVSWNEDASRVGTNEE